MTRTMQPISGHHAEWRRGRAWAQPLPAVRGFARARRIIRRAACRTHGEPSDHQPEGRAGYTVMRRT